MLIFNQREWRSVRTDDHPGEDVSEDNRSRLSCRKMSVARAATLITIAKSFRKVASCMSDVFPRLKQILRISGVKVLHQHEGEETSWLTTNFFAPATRTCPTREGKKIGDFWSRPYF